MTQHIARPVTCLVVWLGLQVTAFAQDLEPRRWSHLPTNVSFIGLATNYSTGDIFLDPVLNIEDGTVDSRALAASYVRSFEWLGRSARIDFAVPFAHTEWDGLLNGMPAQVTRQGFADPTVRLSMNFLGAPPLKGQAFQAYRAGSPTHTTVGGALGILIPAGEYLEDRLLNLGSNRWILRPQLGVLHERGKWQYELTGSVLLFGDNDDFVMDWTREQDPLWLAQGHLIHTFRPGLWASLSAAYGFGGESTINGVPSDDDGRVRYWALSLGVPISPRQGLKFAYIYSRTNTLTGSDLDTFTLAWSLMVGR